MVSNQIIEVLNDICNKFGLAIDWTSKNVQPYLQELMTKCVAYKFATSIMWLIFGILACTIGSVFAKLAVSSWKKYRETGPISDYEMCLVQKGMIPDPFESGEGKDWEVIGNIFDNPELIGETKDGESR